jgi:hypothetical protein
MGVVKKYLMNKIDHQYKKGTIKESIARMLMYHMKYKILDSQERCAKDPKQKALCAALSDIKPGVIFNDTVMDLLYDRHKTPEELQSWMQLESPIVSTGDKEGHLFAWYNSVKFARANNVPIFVWKNKMVSPSNMHSLNKNSLKTLLESRRELTSWFVYNLPGILNGQSDDRNLCTQLAIVNGARCRFKAMVFDNESSSAFVNSIPNQGFQIMYLPDRIGSPSHISVELEGDYNESNWPIKNLSLNKENDKKPTILVSTEARTVTVKNYAGKFDFTCYSPGVSCSLAFTDYKMQGQTFQEKYVALFSHQPIGGKNARTEDIIVMATRATKSDGWAILKLNETDNLEHLRSLRYPDTTIVFFNAIDPTTGTLNAGLITDELKQKLADSSPKSNDMTEKRAMEAILQIGRSGKDENAIATTINGMTVEMLKFIIRVHNIELTGDNKRKAGLMSAVKQWFSNKNNAETAITMAKIAAPNYTDGLITKKIPSKKVPVSR